MTAKMQSIIKNTAFLYVRMLITIVVALYTSRVLLNTLGPSDFGLYHVVAGVVVLAGFFQGALSGTTQRFIAYELGIKGDNNLKNVFSMSVNIHLLFALILIVIGGALGAYFLPSLLTFDESRSSAVVIVFLFSLLSFSLNIAVVPFHAMVIAHEEMKVFAWISIIQAFLNLGAVFLIRLLPYDPLIAYGFLTSVVTLLTSLSYIFYVTGKYEERAFRYRWDHIIFRRLFSFSGWTIWGNSSVVFANQGTSVLLNIFFGPIVNAAKSVGDQVSSALNQFVTNLQTAINPQIIKSYS